MPGKKGRGKPRANPAPPAGHGGGAGPGGGRDPGSKARQRGILLRARAGEGGRGKNGPLSKGGQEARGTFGGGGKRELFGGEIGETGSLNGRLWAGTRRRAWGPGRGWLASGRGGRARGPKWPPGDGAGPVAPAPKEGGNGTHPKKEKKGGKKKKKKRFSGIKSL